jgi:hypothetical protein
VAFHQLHYFGLEYSINAYYTKLTRLQTREMGGTNRVTASTSPQGANIASSTAASSKTDRKRKEDDALSEESLRLQRKRLSDRRSQRTAREKTRQRIKELERALEKLSAANAGSKLQEQIAENMALRKENAQLKRRLGHISSLCRIGQYRLVFPKWRNELTLKLLGEIDAEELDYGLDKQGDRSDKSAEPCQSQAEDDYVGNSMTTATHLVTPHVAPEIDLDRMDVEAEVPADVNEREVFAPANIWSTSDTVDDLTFWSTTVNTNEVPAWPWPILENVQFYENNVEEASGPEILETPLSGNEMGTTVDWNIPSDALKDHQQTMSMQFFGERFVSETQPQQPSSLGYSSSGVDSDTQVVVPRQGYHSHKGPRSFRTFNAASGLRANHLMLGITASPITFLNWIQTVVEKYSCFTEERLDALLPRVPCIHPYFGDCAQSCDKLLSLGLSKVLQSCMPLVDFTSLLGAYHILHRLLRVSQYNILLVSG